MNSAHTYSRDYILVLGCSANTVDTYFHIYDSLLSILYLACRYLSFVYFDTSFTRILMNLLRKLLGNPLLSPSLVYLMTTTGRNWLCFMNISLSSTTKMLPLWSNNELMPSMTGCWARLRSIRATLLPFFTVFRSVSSCQINYEPWGRNWPSRSDSYVCGEKNMYSSGVRDNSSKGKSVLMSSGNVRSLTIEIASNSGLMLSG